MQVVIRQAIQRHSSTTVAPIAIKITTTDNLQCRADPLIAQIVIQSWDLIGQITQLKGTTTARFSSLALTWQLLVLTAIKKVTNGASGRSVKNVLIAIRIFMNQPLIKNIIPMHPVTIAITAAGGAI